VEDLAEAHYLGLSYIMEKQCTDSFNLGSETGFTVLEIIKTFEELSGLKVPFEIVGRRAGDPAVLVAGNEKAEKLLHWVPRKSDLKTILTDAWHWEQKRKF
jgi:UDP-glucose 4-epimerase